MKSWYSLKDRKSRKIRNYTF